MPYIERFFNVLTPEMMNLLNAIKVKAGRLIRVKNIDAKPAASAKYVAVWVEDACGSNERCLLFTEHEIKRAEERAEKNEEDLTKKSWLTDLLD